MSIVGPRPLLVRDMVFMTPEQRMRHTVYPGLTGLAQVKGRNAITWEEKLAFDLEYIRRFSFRQDFSIICLTVRKVLQREGISSEGMATAADLGDYLLSQGRITRNEYESGQEESRELLAQYRQ